MVWSEGNMSLKNPVTIDPGTVRLVAQLPQAPLSIQYTGIFPDLFKIAVVKPPYKKEGKASMKKYWPILLFTVSQVF